MINKILEKRDLGNQLEGQLIAIRDERDRYYQERNNVVEDLTKVKYENVLFRKECKKRGETIRKQEEEIICLNSLLEEFEIVRCDCGNYSRKDDLIDTEGMINGGIGHRCQQCCIDNDIGGGMID